MFLLAWRQLQLDRLRTLLTAVALGAVMAAILVLQGFELGQYAQLKRGATGREADLIVTQPGISNFLLARSSVPQTSRAEVESVPGVITAEPVTTVLVIYEKHGKRTPILVFVTDKKGGPRTILEGRAVREEGDIVVDRSLAVKHDIHVGDPFIVSDFEFTVSGIAKDSAAFFTPFAFIGYDGMIDFFLDSELAPDISTFPLLSFLLVEIEPGANRDSIARDIETRAPSVAVSTPEELAEGDVQLGRGFLGPIIGLLVMVAYVVGLLVAGLIMYAEVTSRLRVFAVLKALGFSSGRLVHAVLVQAVLLLLIGIPIGVILAQVTAVSIQSAAPLYQVPVFEFSMFARTVGASLIFVGAGALMPLRRIRRTDPMLAFEGA